METRTQQNVPSIAGVDYRHFVLATVGFVYVTALLGVATRAAGAGLACDANWPLCDGGLLNLFPATVPSAFEWIHRVVAMIAGFFIVGTAAGAWRGQVDRRVRWAVTVGLVLLPIQVLLGRETVLSFTPPVLGAHYWAAMAIYAAFLVAAILVWEDRLTRRHVRAGVAAAAVLVPAHVALSPNFVARYTAPVQSAQYAVTFALFAGLLLAAYASREAGTELQKGLAGTTALVPVVVLLGRQRIVHDVPALAVAHTAGTVLLLAAVFTLAYAVFVRNGS